MRCSFAYWVLSIAYCLLPVAVAYFLLPMPAALRLQHVAHRLLSVGYCILPIVYRLSIAYCLLRIASAGDPRRRRRCSRRGEGNSPMNSKHVPTI